ncbi:NADH:ubiquinone oxidoreductase subunit C2 S homeolog [Xenopus laevis]|uniref:NADH dehydrogenase [ubiquinone] 1 subunit C2 n=1 Tax=Xenopus laevis TaxID=8355 RepID=A3KMU9_XENLA|nr:NADH:ubiquinone oxidoreductase subunit C2 S homeolog [Xenopus laevis]AAI33274.1 LOC100049100 protein [Xenopus laevis]
MGLLPDEARVLPPPGLVNRNSLWMGFMGYMSAITHNAIRHMPALRAGVHRQVLLTSIGVFLGYHATKYENYRNAKIDRDLREYIGHHPGEFKVQEKKTMAEVLEDFTPIR